MDETTATTARAGGTVTIGRETIHRPIETENEAKK
jgi:hypothetical protein